LERAIFHEQQQRLEPPLFCDSRRLCPKLRKRCTASGRRDLYRRALAYTKNDAHADDLVQETLLKAYKAFDKLRLETHLRAWLLCIMRNTWINNYRADLRRPVETLVGDIADGQLDSVVPHGSGHVLSAEHQALRHMLDPELAAALLTLSEDMRETVYYVAVLGMKCREEAELMGVPAGTPYREYTASGPTCAGHWAWMRATLTAATRPRTPEPLYETSQKERHELPNSGRKSAARLGTRVAEDPGWRAGIRWHLRSFERG